MEMTVEEANKALEIHLKIYYSMTLDDVEITDVKGYWHMKKLCDENCHHPIHTCLGCKGRMHHSIHFVQHYRNDKGQFRSPYLVWKVLHEEKTRNKV